MTVPSGGISISATVANGAGAQTVTLPAANYYWTQAGGVSSLLTVLQTQLNGTSALHGFPRTAATVATAIGYGTWTTGAGYLMQEASGDLAAVFGSPATLTDSGTPTYQNSGIKSGDYAIGFDAGTEYFDGGNVFDVTGTDDLIIAWVGYISATPVGSSDDVFSKIGAGAGYTIFLSTSGTIALFGQDAAAATLFNIGQSSQHVGEWHVGIAAIDRATARARIGTQSLSTGTQSVSTNTAIAATTMTNAVSFRIGDRSSGGGRAPQDMKISAAYVVSGAGVASGLPANLTTALTNFANAINSAWALSLSTTDGRISLAWTGYATPTWSWGWSGTTNLRDAFGFTADISGVTTTQTGTRQAMGLWFPDSPLNVDDHPAMAPRESDLRTSESPTGVAFGLCGTERYAHTNARWTRCPVAQIREASATYANGSFEKFWRDTQTAQTGNTLFIPASPVQIYWNNAGSLTLLGIDANSSTGVSGWRISGVANFRDACKMSQAGWAGQFDVRFPRLVSAG